MTVLIAFLLSSNIFLITRSAQIEEENTELQQQVRNLSHNGDTSKSTLKDVQGE
jgi:hypothetical protein